MSNQLTLTCPIRGVLKTGTKSKDGLKPSEEFFRVEAIRHLIKQGYPKEHFKIEAVVKRIGVPVHDILGEDYPDNQRATVECSRDTPGGFGLEVGMIPLRGGRWDGGLFPGWYPRSRVGKA
jgi:hypothetical protein